MESGSQETRTYVASLLLLFRPLTPQQVSSNTLALHRSPTNFSHPLLFAPERWSTSTRDPSWNHDIRAFIPFTGGTFSCAGKALALLELRLFTVRLLKAFDFRLEEGFNQEEFWEGVRCWQSLIKGRLGVRVERREGPAKEASR
jgi:hypothetical protein